MKLPWWMAKIEFWIGVVVVGLFTYAHITEPPRRREPEAPKPEKRRAEISDFSRVLIAQREITRLLKDPDSAKFGDAYVSRKGAVPVVCGTVNARNSFGGMGGAQRFMSNAGMSALEEQVADGGFDDVWRKMC